MHKNKGILMMLSKSSDKIYISSIFTNLTFTILEIANRLSLWILTKENKLQDEVLLENSKRVIILKNNQIIEENKIKKMAIQQIKNIEFILKNRFIIVIKIIKKKNIK